MDKTELLDKVVLGDCLALFTKVPNNSVQTMHTSPPYNIEKSYEGNADNIGQNKYLDLKSFWTGILTAGQHHPCN